MPSVRTVRFHVAPPGWRIFYVMPDGSTYFEDLPGWLEIEIYRADGELIPIDARERDIMAATLDHMHRHYLLGADNHLNMAGVFGPSASDAFVLDRVADWKEKFPECWQDDEPKRERRPPRKRRPTPR